MKIGFIGIGQMGSHMSRRLLEAGNELAVNDIRKEAAQPLIEKGARWLDTPGEIAAWDEVVLTSLPSLQAVEQVVYGAGGLMAGWKRGDLYIDTTTNSPDMLKRVARDAAAKGVAVLEAPVLGRQSGAEAGTLVVAVGGAAADLERARPILEVIGNRIFHMGEIGCGNTAKVINNLLSTTANAIIGEGFMLGAKAGLDMKKLWEVVRNSPGNSWWLEHGWPQTVFRGNFEGGSINLAVKDVGLARSLGNQYGIPMPLAAAVEQKYLEAKTAGLGDKGTSGLILRLEELTGVQVRW